MEFADVLVMVTVIGFVALGTAYVRWCDRLVGPDPVSAESSDGPAVGSPVVSEVR